MKFIFDGLERTGLLFHLRSYDCKRLQRKLGSVSAKTLEEIKIELCKLILNQKTPLPGSRDITATADAEASRACQ